MTTEAAHKSAIASQERRVAYLRQQLEKAERQLKQLRERPQPTDSKKEE